MYFLGESMNCISSYAISMKPMPMVASNTGRQLSKYRLSISAGDGSPVPLKDDVSICFEVIITTKMKNATATMKRRSQ